jgi:two-component sensor histidine kinase
MGKKTLDLIAANSLLEEIHRGVKNNMQLVYRLLPELLKTVHVRLFFSRGTLTLLFRKGLA